MSSDVKNPELIEATQLLAVSKPKSPSGFVTFAKNIVLDNPVLILMIGLCPTLATSTTAFDAAGMSAAVFFVLVMSNVFISLLRKIIPSEVRIPVFIVVISTFVTIIDYVMQAYQPGLYRVLGIFVPLIVVNCIILGRAEAYAYTNSIWGSFLDGINKSLGFAVVIILIGSIREILGKGTWFSIPVLPKGFQENSILFFTLSPGAFLVIGLLKALVNKVFKRVG